MTRATVIETEDFRLELELGPNGEHILHMPTIKHWSVSVYKKLLVLAAELHEWAKKNNVQVMYTGAPLADIKTIKFHTMLGFEPYGVTDWHGERFQVMRQQCLI